MTKREENLIPFGVPKWIRIYDNEGEADRYTIIYTGRYSGKRNGWYQYVGMSPDLLYCIHGESFGAIDTDKWGFAPAVGKRNRLGVRIGFKDLPKGCQKIVLEDYREIWGLK